MTRYTTVLYLHASLVTGNYISEIDASRTIYLENHTMHEDETHVITLVRTCTF